MFVVMKLSQISGQNSSHHSLCVFAYLSSPSVDLAIYLGGGGGGRNNLIIVIFLKVYSCVFFLVFNASELFVGKGEIPNSSCFSGSSTQAR